MKVYLSKHKCFSINTERQRKFSCYICLQPESYPFKKNVFNNVDGDRIPQYFFIQFFNWVFKKSLCGHALAKYIQ